MNDETQTPTLAEVILGAQRVTMRGVRVALPGRIEAYNPVTREANVLPLVMDRVTGEEGEVTAKALPVVPHVPVLAVAGGRIKFPIAVGDTVLLVFASSSLDLWLARGGLVDPEDDRHHAADDAVAIHGLQDFAHVLAPVPALEFTGATINVGGSAPLALAAQVEALRQSIIADLTANGLNSSITTGLGAITGTTITKGA